MPRPKLVQLHTDGEVATITLSDPRTRNALDLKAMLEIAESISKLASEGTTAALIIRGDGDAFSAGASLADGTEVDGAEIMSAAQQMIHTVVSAPFPVITAVTGAAAGIGASLVFASDLAVASEQAFFLLPFVGIGLIPDGGATVTISSSVGRAKALHMALLQERISAVDAEAWGLIAGVCGHEEVDEISREWAARCAATPKAALQATKAAINEATFGNPGSPLGSLTETLERERTAQLKFLASPDYEESIRRFRKNRE